MPPEEIRNYLRNRPFVPFRIRLSDGRVFDIRNQELVMVGRRIVVIGIPEAGDTESLPLLESSLTVSLLHVVSIEPIPAPAQAG
jgi:hypothetical protein